MNRYQTLEINGCFMSGYIFKCNSQMSSQKTIKHGA